MQLLPYITDERSLNGEVHRLQQNKYSDQIGDAVPDPNTQTRVEKTGRQHRETGNAILATTARTRRW
jgi:hypothetical protein